MEIQEFSNKIRYYMNMIEVEISDDQIEKFFKYMQILLDWNKKINLTTITEPNDIIIKHFVDCGTIIKYIKNDYKVIDIGTGAGFPGIPLKILNESINLTLVDSLNKRIVFLNEVINTLNLSNVELIHARAEELAKNNNYREKYDRSVSRAVSNMSTLVELVLPFVKIEGKSIIMKGFNIENELAESKKAIKVLGGKLEKIKKFDLVNTDNKRSIILLKKYKETPEKYPRKPGKPAKDPIR